MPNNELVIPDEQALDVQENESLTQDGAPDESQDDLCVICHTREKDLSQSSQSVMCSECRQNYIKLRIPWGIKAFLAAVCAVFLLSIYSLPSILSAYHTYIKADKQMKSREYAFAFNSYSSVLAEYPGSVPVALKAADAALSAQDLAGLAQTLDDHLVGKPLNDTDYTKAMEYVHVLDAYGETYDEIQRIVEQTEVGFADEPSDENSDAFVEQCKALLSKDGLDKTQIYYVMASVSLVAEDRAEYLRLATEQDPRFTYPYADYGTALRRIGKFDEAKQIYTKALSLNACDALAMRGMGVLQLLEGDKAGALEMAQRAYEIEPNGSYVASALVIALCENGQREEAMGLFDELTKQGTEYTDDLRQYLDGKLSLEQYYMS